MIDRININGVTYSATALEAGAQATGITITVDGVTYLLGDVIAPMTEQAASTEASGNIDKISVNGVVYDIRDVEDVAAERKRAMEAEGEIRDNFSEELGREIDARMLADIDIRRKGVLFGGFSHRQTTANEVVIGYKDIDQNYEGVFTIPAATTEKAGVMSANDKKKLNSLSPGGGGGGVAELMVEVTYSELVALRDNASLIAGMKYRITDYVTTTVQQDTKSANHPFDVIVEAVSENELSELAQAIQHEGDTYFDGNDLGAWQLWYDLDNNTDKYEWADAENGKGVIYRMIDEKRNDCPYDFKNILFYTTYYTSYTTSDKYYYTFSYVVSGVLYDGTVEKRIMRCRNNSMGAYKYTVKKYKLNGNIFRNTSFDNRCLYNTFGYDSYSNIFEYGCSYNKFGNSCDNNTFKNSCYYNTFGDGCYYNTFGENCYYNTFGENCYDNTFGRRYCYNTFGNGCHHIEFGNDCSYNKFGNDCSYKTFEKSTNNRKLDYGYTSITLNKEYYDDGNNALVPVKHPDLSTQPSILPYKFMGQYVYEQLIPTSEILIKDDTAYLPASLIDGSFILDCCGIGTYGAVPIYLNYQPSKKNWILFHDRVGAGGFKNFNYIKIVYTSMPEEGGDYYYNSATSKGILFKIELSDTTLSPMYDGNTWVEPVVQGQEYYYDIPNDYGYSTTAAGIKSSYEPITVLYSIPDIGETGQLNCDYVAKMIELPDELVDKAKQYLVLVTIK